MQRILLLTLCMLCAAVAQAHKIKVFSYIEADQVLGQVYFVGGKPAANVQVALLGVSANSPSNSPHKTVKTDTEGRFAFEQVAANDYQLIADAGEGHVAKWLFKQQDFPSWQSVQQSSQSGVKKLAEAPTEAKAVKLDPALETAIARQVQLELSKTLDQQLSRHIIPLRAELDSYVDKVALGDTLGGIGYIVGLFGLFAWWRSRQ